MATDPSTLARGRAGTKNDHPQITQIAQIFRMGNEEIRKAGTEAAKTAQNLTQRAQWRRREPRMNT